ncbi:MAG: hypothetical protein RL160_1465 [Bacteroidota bacterium]
MDCRFRGPAEEKKSDETVLGIQRLIVERQDFSSAGSKLHVMFGFA